MRIQKKEVDDFIYQLKAGQLNQQEKFIFF